MSQMLADIRRIVTEDVSCNLAFGEEEKKLSILKLGKSVILEDLPAKNI